MSFDEMLDQIRELLRQRGRLSYGALKRRFDLDDAYVEDIKGELIKAERVAADENGEVLVWAGKGINGETDKWKNGEESLESKQVQGPKSKVQSQENQPLTSNPQHPAAERRQLTVMFCDLVGSTALSAQLDPEDYRAVVQQYQQTCAEVIQRHEGHLAQYLGDGLLVYFGYPTAHEDDARRAVRTGLEITAAIAKQVPSPLVGEPVLCVVTGGQGEGAAAPHRPLQVRIGIHTGLVVIGDIGTSGRTEQLALGETPNIAARIQGLAEPNTVIISAATHRLIEDQFESQPFGSHLVKGLDTPIAVYHVQSERQSASPLAGHTTLTPLVGREQEVGLLIDRWEQAKEGRGQVVLLSGEPGIGKSRLAYTLREHVTAEGSLLFEARCSPYYQHSAFYPLIDVLQRTLLFTRQDTDHEKGEKLERTLALYNLQDSLPLFAALLSLPPPSQYPQLNLTPQKQKERTLQALLQLMMAQAERQATVSVWEDLHWADPSSLEFLSLLIEQIPTTKLLLVLTFRPEFIPPWKPRSHLSQLMLNRLGKKQVEVMIEKVTERQNLPAEVIEQIRVKTDGVPLFVEELTKSVVETVGATGRLPLQTFAIPATLQEALLARLDRLSTARQIAQLGATLGREFSHELIQAVTLVSETALHTALEKLVEAEILYQRGVGEQARYFFKHALIQDTAYQSLLKSTRQQYHQQIAQVLEERFPDIKANQPELLAHHYTEANLLEQAIPYWQQAGQQASRRSAYVEAENYLKRGIESSRALPETMERIRQEIRLQITLGGALMMAKGVSAPAVGATLTRAYDLCQQLDDPVQLFAVLTLLRSYRDVRGEAHKALEHAQQMLQIAQQVQDAGFSLQASVQLGVSYYVHGELTLARENLERGEALYDPQQHRHHASLYGIEPKVMTLIFFGWTLWGLGYPDQALRKNEEAVSLARELSHPASLAFALTFLAWLHVFCREEQKLQGPLAEAIQVGTEYGIANVLASCRLVGGWAMLGSSNAKAGVQQIEEALLFMDSLEQRTLLSQSLACQVQGQAELGQVEAGLSVLSQALEFAEQGGERVYKAELYRLRGELTLSQSNVQRLESSVQKAAESCFLLAIEIAREQQAKSWELRASTSLARLWQQQGKGADAHRLLSDVYNWFIEGFDTKDLQEAKALLDSLGSSV